jgi:hypothetical protein
MPPPGPFTLAVLCRLQTVMTNLITVFSSSDIIAEPKAIRTITGLSKILGEPHGESKDSSGLREISVLTPLEHVVSLPLLLTQNFDRGNILYHFKNNFIINPIT